MVQGPGRNVLQPDWQDITLRLDQNVVDWFKEHAENLDKAHQDINQALMEHIRQGSTVPAWSRSRQGLNVGPAPQVPGRTFQGPLTGFLPATRVRPPGLPPPPGPGKAYSGQSSPRHHQTHPEDPSWPTGQIANRPVQGTPGPHRYHSGRAGSPTDGRPNGTEMVELRAR